MTDPLDTEYLQYLEGELQKEEARNPELAKLREELTEMGVAAGAELQRQNDEPPECAWCGDPNVRFRNRHEEEFCSKAHRDASNRARKRFLLCVT